MSEASDRIGFARTAHTAVASNSSIEICRNRPGDPNFPNESQWNHLNSTVGGRLLNVMPSAQYCQQLPGGCTAAQWTSSGFRGQIPGAMDDVNWEQDYSSNPPSLCLFNSSQTACGQGNVPLYAINASSVADIQAGINFARRHNLRLAIKSSGHDFLGRSTAKDSLLLWTHYFRNMSFTESFSIGETNYGSAVTVGSGVPLNEIYLAAKAEDKIFVGGNAAHVVAAGGYAQGAGHSAYSPVFGLAADNALQFDIILANGSLVAANEVQYPDLFWALRGGGAGSWGVILSATFQTYPTFNATLHTVQILTGSNSSTGDLCELHARHIFDWDEYRAGQYFISLPNPGGGNSMAFLTYFPNLTVQESMNAMKSLLDDARAMNFTVYNESVSTSVANDLVYSADDNYSGVNAILGSRLIPADAYKNNPEGIGRVCANVLELGAPSFLGLLVGGGKVAENTNIDSAVNPKWRTAKVHFITTSIWDDSLSPEDVENVKQQMTQRIVPTIANVTGEPDSGAYSNEADVREPDFQTTFFGPNYARLRGVKDIYDPYSMFIVPAGVGSEDWDDELFCRRYS